MAARDDHPLHIPIHLVLARVAASSQTPPPWYEAWSRLGPESSEEDRLAVYRAVRAAGSVPDDASFFLVAWQTDAVVVESNSTDEALRPYEDRLAKIRRAHGLGDGVAWPPGQVPAEYAHAWRREHAAWDAIYGAALEMSGGLEMARLFRTDRPRFEELYEAGRRFFHGPRPGILGFRGLNSLQPARQRIRNDRCQNAGADPCNELPADSWF